MSKRGELDPKVAEEMRDIGRSIADALPPGYGFCLLTFPFGPEGRTNYISNANREDMVEALEEFLGNVKEGVIYEGPRKKKH